ncbi:MAG: hypothetical protein ACLUJG_15745 [Lawsonibacter sp.]
MRRLRKAYLEITTCVQPGLTIFVPAPGVCRAFCLRRGFRTLAGGQPALPATDSLRTSTPMGSRCSVPQPGVLSWRRRTPRASG